MVFKSADRITVSWRGQCLWGLSTARALIFISRSGHGGTSTEAGCQDVLLWPLQTAACSSPLFVAPISVLLSRFRTKLPSFASYFSLACYMPSPCHIYCCDHSNNVWERVQIMKLLFPVLLLRPKKFLYFSQYLVSELAQFIFFSYDEMLSLMYPYAVFRIC
jgi:hypothetical protein